MKHPHRQVLREMVANDDNIDVIIVHRSDGGNDIFSARPDADSCERDRVIEICLDLAITLESMPARLAKCPGKSRKGSGCPA